MTIVDDIAQLQSAAHSLAEADAEDQIASALAACRRAMEALQEIAPALVERGVHKGMTQRRMARLLGVPERTLAGAKREFARV